MKFQILLIFAIASAATCEFAGDRLLLGTDKRGASVFTPSPPGIRQITRDQNVYAVTYDAIRGRAYWSDDASKQIYRSDLEGQEIEQLYSFQRSQSVRALAMDSASRDLYIVVANTTLGPCEMSICNVETNKCAQVERSLFENVHGLALHPEKGYMYWTNRFSGGGEIIRAYMDGSSSFPIVSGVYYNPGAITIDKPESRLYWTLTGSNSLAIQSSELNGNDLKDVVMLPTYTYAFGIAIIGDTIYWSRRESTGGVGSCSKSDCVIQNMFNASTSVNHIAAIGPLMSNTLGFDQCAEANCSHVCVPKGATYRCMCPAGTQLGRNGKACTSIQ